MPWVLRGWPEAGTQVRTIETITDPRIERVVPPGTPGILIGARGLGRLSESAKDQFLVTLLGVTIVVARDQIEEVP